MNQKDWSKPSKQICVHKGRSSLLEFENCMRPPSKWYPWHLHAEGLEDEGKPSLIRMVMVDYGNEDHSISVYANLRPKEIKWLYHQIIIGVSDVSFRQHKIFREDKKSNQGKVTILSINRYEKTSAGEKRDQPWRIEIQNGTGIVIRNSIGGQMCKQGSYKKEKTVTVNLTDQEAFMMFAEVSAVIKFCEREHLFHRRDVENLTKLFKFYKSSTEKLSHTIELIKDILEKSKEKEDDMAA